jgi:hypothetical protein
MRFVLYKGKQTISSSQKFLFIFYAVRVVSKESRGLVLPRASCYRLGASKICVYVEGTSDWNSLGTIGGGGESEDSQETWRRSFAEVASSWCAGRLMHMDVAERMHPWIVKC